MLHAGGGDHGARLHLSAVFPHDATHVLLGRTNTSPKEAAHVVFGDCNDGGVVVVEIGVVVTKEKVIMLWKGYYCLRHHGGSYLVGVRKRDVLMTNSDTGDCGGNVGDCGSDF